MAAPNNRPAAAGGTSMGRMIVGVLIFSLLLWFGWKQFGHLLPSGVGGDYTYIPEEMQITYVPVDFKANLDEEEVLKILSNPNANRRAFNDMVYNLNMSILTHVGKRMNLPDSLSVQLEGEYRKHHSYLRSLYLSDILKLRDTTAATYEQWYANDATKAVDALNEVSAKYTCFLVNQVILTLVKSQDGMLAGKGARVDTPCSMAMQEALQPMIGRLQERAAIRDFSRSKGLMEERVERVIAELATLEIRDKKAMSKELKTKFLGYNVSSTEIELSAISLMKVGFKLDEYFDVKIDSRRKNVIVTVPQPKILSHEVYPRVDKLDVGWMRELQGKDFNKNFNALRAEFRREAIESDAFDKSRVQAKELLGAMLGPMVAGINKKYDLIIRFKNNSNLLPEDPDLDISDTAYDKIEETETRQVSNPTTPSWDTDVSKTTKKKPSKKKKRKPAVEEDEDTPVEYIPY